MVDTGDDNETPRRRSGDYMTYRDMVEYVTYQLEREHTVRAEIVVQFSNALEKVEALTRESIAETRDAFATAIAEIRSAFTQHEVWHRDVMQKMIANQPSVDSAKSNIGVQRTMLAIAGAALIVSILSVVATFAGR